MLRTPDVNGAVLRYSTVAALTTQPTAHKGTVKVSGWGEYRERKLNLNQMKAAIIYSYTNVKYSEVLVYHLSILL